MVTRAWLLGVASSLSTTLDPTDPLKDADLAMQPQALPMSQLERNMQSQTQSVGAKAQAAHRLFAQQWKDQMNQIDSAGIMTAPMLRQALHMAKAKLAADMQQASAAQTEPDDQTGQTEQAGQTDDSYGDLLQEQLMGIVRFTCDVSSVNLLEPADDRAGETATFVGSGFVVEKDDEHGPLIVTNAHVVNDAARVQLTFPSSGKEPYSAQPILVNHDWDIALVRLVPDENGLEKLKKVSFGEKGGYASIPVFPLYTGTINAAMDVVAEGFPLGSEHCAVTKGEVSGIEVVAGNIQIQSSAPISPGNSGGPLFIKGTSTVLGINFASSGDDLAQNVNYAIPSYRVSQVLAHLHAHPETHNVQSCKAAPATCDMSVPKVNAVTVPGTAQLYAAFGCGDDGEGVTGGVFVTKVAQRSILAHADPPITEDSFITSVDGISLDRFGMGLDSSYLHEPVHFHDILFMRKDLATPGKLTTCSCGTKQEHSLSLEWHSGYESNVPDNVQPFLSKLDFELFGELTIQPMSLQLAKALVMQAGMLQLASYVTDVDHPPALVVTGAPQSQDFGGGGAAVQIGSIVTRVNGKTVKTLAEFRAAYEPEAAAACQAHAAGDGTPRPTIWTLETQDGAFYGAPYETTLEGMVNDKDRGPLTQTVKDEATKAGINVSHIGTVFMEGAVPKDVQPQASGAKFAMPIEVRSIERGGRTRSLSFFEEVHAIVPPKQLAATLGKMLEAAQVRLGKHEGTHLADMKAQENRSPSLLEKAKDKQETKDVSSFPNWFDGLVDLAKPFAGLGR